MNPPGLSCFVYQRAQFHSQLFISPSRQTRVRQICMNVFTFFLKFLHRAASVTYSITNKSQSTLRTKSGSSINGDQQWRVVLKGNRRNVTRIRHISCHINSLLHLYLHRRHARTVNLNGDFLEVSRFQIPFIFFPSFFLNIFAVS